MMFQFRQPRGDLADHVAAGGQRHLAVLEALEAPCALLGGGAGRQPVAMVVQRPVRGLHLDQGLGVDLQPAGVVLLLQVVDAHLQHVDLRAQRLQCGLGRVRGLGPGQRAAPFLDLGGQGLALLVGAGEGVDHAAHLGVGHPLHGGLVDALEADRRAQAGADDDRQEHRGHLGQPTEEHPHHEAGADGEDHRRQVGLVGALQQRGHVAHEAAGAGVGHVHDEAQLRQADDDRGGVGEADQHRVRHQVDDAPQLEGAHQQAQHPHHEGEQDGQGDELVRTGQGERGDGRRRHQRQHDHRPGVQEVEIAE
jgi:hypothetical protein